MAEATTTTDVNRTKDLEPISGSTIRFVRSGDIKQAEPDRLGSAFAEPYLPVLLDLRRIDWGL
jgi:hypothetical protein